MKNNFINSLIISLFHITLILFFNLCNIVKTIYILKLNEYDHRKSEIRLFGDYLDRHVDRHNDDNFILAVCGPRQCVLCLFE
jgi:hypothetical protein